MGYCIQVHDYDFMIRKSNFPKALEAIKSLVQEHNLACVSANSVLESKTLGDAMRLCNWSFDTDDATGDAVMIFFEGEKLLDDEKLFEAIAPFVEDGSYIDMMGEDGYAWRWLFKDGKLKELSGELVFKEY